MSDHEQPEFEAYQHPGMEADSPLSDGAQLDLLDAMVEERGRVPATQVLRANFRTLSNCRGFR